MSVLALFPHKQMPVEKEVTETAHLMTTMLKLQHYTPEKALLALTIAADGIEIERGNKEALKMKAVLRGANAVRELTETEGGQLSAEEFGRRLNISRETVNQWRQQGKVLAWKRGTRNFSYPAWQIHKGALLPGLEATIATLVPVLQEPMEVADYFLSESDELGGRPLDLLRQRYIEAVVEHAGRYGEIGA